MQDEELLAYVDRVRPEVRAALLVEVKEMQRVDQKFLSAGFSSQEVALLHSVICVALGLEDEIKSFGLSREVVDDLRAIVHYVMGLQDRGRTVITDQLAALDDDAFFQYLAALDRRPDAPAEIVTQAWTELQRRRRQIEDKMDAECAAAGMSTGQTAQLKCAIREIFGVRREDEV